MTTATGDALKDAEVTTAHVPPSLPRKSPVPELLGRIGGATRVWAGERLGMDYRSLALMRMCMGALVMWVAYTHGIESRIFFTDQGVLPRTTAIGGAPQGFSLHFAHGSMAYITGLFVLQGVFGFMMMVGYRTRLATIGSYILLLSMQNRHLVLLFGADIVMRVSLFWTMFLPLGERYSMDRLVGRTGPRENRGWWTGVAAGAAIGVGIGMVPGVAVGILPRIVIGVSVGVLAGMAGGLVTGLDSAGKAKGADEKTYLGIGGIAFFLQFASIYVTTSLMKDGARWQTEHTAVSYALALDVYSRPMGHWLAGYPTITKWLTISTIYLELYGPYLFIFPVFNKWTRMLAILLFGGLQVGFGMCMFLGIFGSIMITITLPFLPAMFWERLAEPAGRLLAKWFGGWARRAGARMKWLAGLWGKWVERERARSALRHSVLPGGAVLGLRLVWAVARDGVLVYLIVLTTLWNKGQLPGQAPILDYPTSTLVRSVGLDQTWDMFAPIPQTEDGWFVVVGTKWNGETVDLMTGASPATFDKPAFVAGSYRNQLWMSFLISFWSDGASDKEAFAAYIGNQWNKTHTGDDRVQTVEINQMSEYVVEGENGMPAKTEPERILLWTEWFYR